MRSRMALAGLATGIAALAAGIAAPSAFAATPPPSSGVVSGTVTVATALTLEITSGQQFSISGAQPGVSYNGVPPTALTVLTNDNGYTLTTYMDDITPPATSQNAGGCVTYAFNDAGHTNAIPDNAWTDKSTGGPGAPGTLQTYSNQDPSGEQYNGSSYNCITTPVAMTVGQSGTISAAAGDNFTEQLALTAPASTPGGVTFTGNLTFLATGA